MIDAFLNSRHVIHATQASTRLLYLMFEYADWCQENGQRCLSDRALRKALKARGFDIKTIRGSAVIFGLRESDEAIRARSVEKARIRAMYQ